MRFAVPRALPGTPLLNAGSHRGLAIRECAGVARILQHLTDSSAARQRPDYLLPASTGFGLGQRNVLFPKPDRRLPRASQLLKFLEYQLDRLLHLAIRSLLNAALFGAHESDGHFPQSEAAPHLLFKSFAR